MAGISEPQEASWPLGRALQEVEDIGWDMKQVRDADDHLHDAGRAIKALTSTQAFSVTNEQKQAIEMKLWDIRLPLLRHNESLRQELPDAEDRVAQEEVKEVRRNKRKRRRLEAEASLRARAAREGNEEVDEVD